MNARLRSAIESARSANMPKDNIERAIDKSSVSANSNFENIRRNLEVDYQIKKKNVIKSIPLEKYISCEGNFGTSIFFDTNTPHFAGQINDKKVYRKILRFTFLKPMNKTSKIRYYFKKIFN